MKFDCNFLRRIYFDCNIKLGHTGNVKLYHGLNFDGETTIFSKIYSVLVAMAVSRLHYSLAHQIISFHPQA